MLKFLKKLIRPAAVFVLLTALAVPLLPVINTTPVYATSPETFYGTASDGRIYNTAAAAWATARATTTATVANTSAATVLAGAYNSSGNWYISRGFMFFDTSALPDDCTVTAVKVYLYPSVNATGDAQNLYVTQGTTSDYPHDPIVGTDFDVTKYSGIGGQIASTSWLNTSYVNISLNSEGLTWINKEGYTKLVFQCQKDYDNTQPTQTSEFAVNYQEQTSTTKDPYIEVTYTSTSGTYTGYSSSSDGYVWLQNSGYSTTWSSTSGTADAGQIYNKAGQVYVASAYTIYKGALYFDTSSIPADAIITSASLNLYGYTDRSDTDCNLIIQNGQPTYPGDPLVGSDYSKSNYAGNGGSFSTASWTLAGYNTINLSSTGLTWITKGGDTKLIIRSDREIAGTTPTGYEYVTWYSEEQPSTTYDPYLTVSWYVLGSVPIVTTSSAQSVGYSSATLAGTLVDTAGYSPVYVSFRYGLTTSYGTNTSELAKTAAGAFTISVDSLNPSATYHFQAVARYGNGSYTYGIDNTLTTNVVLSNPYTGGTAYKGQVHTHTTGSDGSYSPAALVTLYRDSGYDFISITDHDVLTPDPGVSGILFIPGVEETATGSQAGHIMALDVTSNVSSADAQTIINTIVADGGSADLAHPNIPGGDWTNAEIAVLSGYEFTEVYNAAGAATAEAADKWDYMLSTPSLHRVWAFAVDDTHTSAQLYKGWIVAYASSLTVDDIMASLRAGNFYSTTGPDLGITTSGTSVTATTSSSSTFVWTKEGGTVVKTETGVLTSSYTTTYGSEDYVRVTVTRDSDSTKAWSQPLFVEFGPVGLPTVTTSSPASVTSTSATFQGIITGLGSYTTVYVSFEFGTSTSYGTSTPQQTYTTTSSYSQAWTGLTTGQTYHYRAKLAYGSGQVTYGSDVLFTTLAMEPPSPPSGFSVSSTSIQNTITWTKTPGAINTMVRWSTDSFPTTITEGTQLYYSTGTSAVHSGLTYGTTYYYSAWSEAISGSSSIFSTTYVSGTGTPGVNVIDTPDTLSIEDVKVFTDYRESGDMLICISYKIIYGTIPAVEVGDYFNLDIYDGDILKVRSKVPFWGYRPASIWLSSTSSTLTWGGDYTVSINGVTGKWGDAPETTYGLSDTNWAGDDLTDLDEWIITLMQSIEDYYGIPGDLTTYVPGSGTVLSSGGSDIVRSAIPGINVVRPDIFYTSVSILNPDSLSPDELSQAGTANASVSFGASVMADFEGLGSYLGGLSGSAVAGIFWFALMLLVSGCAMLFGGSAVLGVLISLPILFIGNALGVISMAVMAVAALLTVAFLLMNLWLARS